MKVVFSPKSFRRNETHKKHPTAPTYGAIIVVFSKILYNLGKAFDLRTLSDLGCMTCLPSNGIMRAGEM